MYLQKCKLEAELEVLYLGEYLRKASSGTAWLVFNTKTQNSLFSETVKLLISIMILPVTTVENKRCFSALNMVKTYRILWVMTDSMLLA